MHVLGTGRQESAAHCLGNRKTYEAPASALRPVAQRHLEESHRDVLARDS